ncbi:MAG: hypothetical protein ACD_70C00080G0003 [uncultured bacterium]|nr:MAG: hypothetical protein ACD_70C00080G0003 [uncultured bacterium]OGT27176.1 MAG: hypothetical protein A3B71_08730 [Gammaproteobacteria bacterium RIFCSPHIGHO2_02_FULL_42_43]OGT28599.1 MAG: hypothetical protein A2624_06540 [Gammaproteobacteria bacterium RIFCSPHIGHO2_01_FULL_42_8]OGT50792.1 MAG: hypothetical protein A3E54_00925 [Gammaproteobacteria bacterium RIFCSPHIGHO2_12_FULL_41_25]OGT61776.1 MAG: hypothetical protein A3I77_00645 [Gammaproteobacteria bacterium RIFCSPLOWO2_02_FULL_42_14]OGT
MPRPSWQTNANIAAKKNLRIQIIQSSAVNNAQVQYLVRYIGGFNAQDQAMALPAVLDAIRGLHRQIDQQVNNAVNAQKQLNTSDLSNPINLQNTLMNPNSLTNLQLSDATAAQMDAQNAMAWAAQAAITTELNNEADALTQSQLTQTATEEEESTTVQTSSSVQTADHTIDEVAVGAAVSKTLMDLESGNDAAFIKGVEKVCEKLTGKEAKLEDFFKSAEKENDKSESAFPTPKPSAILKDIEDKK